VSNLPDRFHIYKDGETISFYVFKGDDRAEIFTNAENTGTSGQRKCSISEARDIWTKYNNMGYITK